jgi:hypothetical protein
MSQVYPVALIKLTHGTRVHFGTFTDFTSIRKGEGYCQQLVTNTLGASKGSRWTSLSVSSRFGVEACEDSLVSFLWQAYAFGSDHAHRLVERNAALLASPTEGNVRALAGVIADARQASAFFSPRGDAEGGVEWHRLHMETMFRCTSVTMRARMVWCERGLYLAYHDFNLLRHVEPRVADPVAPSESVGALWNS